MASQPPMSPDEVLDRARFLINRHGHISTGDLVRFCQGRVAISDVRSVLQTNFLQIGSDEYADRQSQQVPPGYSSLNQMYNQAMSQMQ